MQCWRSLEVITTPRRMKLVEKKRIYHTPKCPVSEQSERNPVGQIRLKNRRHLLQTTPFSSPLRRARASCSCRRGSAAPLKTATLPSSIFSPSPWKTMTVALTATEKAMATVSPAVAAAQASPAQSLCHKTPPPLSEKYRRRRRKRRWRRTSSPWPRPATTCGDRKRQKTLIHNVLYSLPVYLSLSRQKAA